MGNLPADYRLSDLQPASERPRYVAHRVDDNAYDPSSPIQFAVHDSGASRRIDPVYIRNDVGPLMIEAESEIIAFALNAVASGATLYVGFATNDVLTAYDGPTEGVRAS
jgi:hypothetical protein